MELRYLHVEIVVQIQGEPYIPTNLYIYIAAASISMVRAEVVGTAHSIHHLHKY